MTYFSDGRNYYPIPTRYEQRQIRNPNYINNVSPYIQNNNYYYGANSSNNIIQEQKYTNIIQTENTPFNQNSNNNFISYQYPLQINPNINIQNPINKPQKNVVQNNNANTSIDIENLIKTITQNNDTNITNIKYEIPKDSNNSGKYFNFQNKDNNIEVNQVTYQNLNNQYNEGYSSKKDEKQNTANIVMQQNQNSTNNKTLTNSSENIFKPNIYDAFQTITQNYYFLTTGLHNIGSTCYLNATIQCLLHVSLLTSYFINIYPHHMANLNKINDSSPSQGKISLTFWGIIKSIMEKDKNPKKTNNRLSAKTEIHQINNLINKAVSPEQFQKAVGLYNPQFRNLEANDSKDLILYLFQIMHQELNYNTKVKPFTEIPNQYDRVASFRYFNNSYEITNYSIISYLFYGTSENVTQCEICNCFIYNFQKFEFLSFGVGNYIDKEFNLYNGFDDYTKFDKLTGDNQYYCHICQKLCNALITTRIITPPKYLLINIDYGKNKRFMPKNVKYDDVIDITKYLSFDYGKPIRYKILGICSHSGQSGRFGHYIAFCRNKNNSKWFKFNDSLVSECGTKEISNGGDPYLLLYEKIE